MEHEENCPWLTNEQNTLLIHTLPKNCQSRKCAVWKDLKSWFGYLGDNLSLLAFQEIYRDVAHDGTGVYERMALEGGNILQQVVEFQEFRGGKEELYLNGVARLIFGKASESYLNFVKQLHHHKMGDLVNDTVVLYNFAKLYLSGAQMLTTPRSVANYVRVCVAFSVNEIAGPLQHSPTAEWIVPLIQHVYHCQKFKHLKYGCDNVLLTNLHRYMDYKYKELLPRVMECFANLQNTPQGTEVHGFVLLDSFARDYFVELYKLYYGDGPESKEFAKSEVVRFLNSKAVELFACVYMKLHLIFLNEELDVMVQRSLRDTKTIFINLLGACWSISQKETRNYWLANLFQNLRQVQLSLMAYTSGSRSLRNLHLGFGQFSAPNLALDKFDLLLNPKKPKLRCSGGEMSHNGEGCVSQYEPFSSESKVLSLGTDSLVKFGGGLMEAYGYVQHFLVENASKLLPKRCFGNEDNDMDDCGMVSKNNNESLEQEEVLPLKVKYEEGSDEAHIKIPLGKIASSKNFNYRTLLKNNDKKLMELSINNMSEEFPSFVVKVPTKK